MKEPWDWEEADIENLISEHVQESLSLDYKRCASLDKKDAKSKHDLSKDVSAFANSAGGTLVYGIEEDNNLPKRIDTGFDPNDVTREWIEQVINSSIQRKIEGIKIKQIELKRSNPGKVIYIVSIPQSNRAPHMAENHVFYKRYNFQSIPMEEYELRDVALRYDAPDLSISLTIDGMQSTKLKFAEGSDYSDSVNLNLIINNQSPTPAMYAVIRLFIDQGIKVSENSEFHLNGQNILKVDDHNFQTNYFSFNWSTPAKMPIWESVPFRVTNTPILLAVPRGEQGYFVVCELHSPRMTPRQKNYVLNVTKDDDVSLLSILMTSEAPSTQPPT
jgi:hypothetical protein